MKKEQELHLDNSEVARQLHSCLTAALHSKEINRAEMVTVQQLCEFLRIDIAAKLASHVN